MCIFYVFPVYPVYFLCISCVFLHIRQHSFSIKSFRSPGFWPLPTYHLHLHLWSFPFCRFQGHPVRVKHDAFMGETGGSKKLKLSQRNVNFAELWGEMYKFCSNRGTFLNFVEIWG